MTLSLCSPLALLTIKDGITGKQIWQGEHEFEILSLEKIDLR